MGRVFRTGEDIIAGNGNAVVSDVANETKG
jgi:hypothetical protein